MRKVLVFIILFSVSCKKEPYYPQEAKFQEMLDHLVLECNERESDDYFKAIIKGQDACYYDGVNGYSKRIDYLNHFVTKGPNTSSGVISSGHVINFGILLGVSDATTYQHCILFQTPVFPVRITKEQYLDSLFSISNHKIIDRNNKEGIKVELNMFDKQSKNSASVYSFYAETGYQKEDSYLRFIKADKVNENGTIYYDIEMEVQCYLYYHKNEDGFVQYGKEGLWGKLENGILKMKVKL